MNQNKLLHPLCTYKVRKQLWKLGISMWRDNECMQNSYLTWMFPLSVDPIAIVSRDKKIQHAKSNTLTNLSRLCTNLLEQNAIHCYCNKMGIFNGWPMANIFYCFGNFWYLVMYIGLCHLDIWYNPSTSNKFKFKLIHHQNRNTLRCIHITTVEVTYWSTGDFIICYLESSICYSSHPPTSIT